MRGYDAWLTHDPSQDYEPPCGAFSPDGKYQCNLGSEHCVDEKHENSVHHKYNVPGQGYHQIRETDLVQMTEYGLQGELDPEYYKVGEFLYVDSLDVTLAAWTQRPDDFDENGNPTVRNEEVKSYGGYL